LEEVKVVKVARKIRGRAVRINEAAAPPPVARPRTTKELLIEKAEQLFGLYGFDAVSFREIAIAAGQANSYAVQYHFKDKLGLIQGIFESRLADLEPIRRELLSNLSEKSTSYDRDLLKGLWLPNLQFRDAAGNHSYCRFLLQYLLQSQIVNHPIPLMYSDSAAVKAASNAAFKKYSEVIPSQIAFMNLMLKFYAKLPVKIFGFRLSAVTKMFLASVVEFDNRRIKDPQSKSTEFDMESMIDMAIAALGAPVKKGRS
jgi:AcrR family transcriptional regulator